jgi:predicted ATPase
VAAVLKQPLEAVEAGYDELTQQGRFLEVQGLAEGPEGSVTVRYQFCHALYQQALYQRLGLAQRVRWHRQLGEHWAALYGERGREIAGAVTGHFERGQGYRRALPFWQQAGEHALQQNENENQKALGQRQAGLVFLSHPLATAKCNRGELRVRH